MADDTTPNNFSDIWSISDQVIEKNKKVKTDVFDIPDEEKVAANVKGYVINDVGNIVAQFGFFVESTDDDKLLLMISPDGFLGVIYNHPTNVIVGYGHKLGFNGMIEPKDSNILHLGPDQAAGENVILDINNDEKLKEQGLVFMIRADDVMLELLSDEVRADFIESLDLAVEPVEHLNEIETSFNAYMRELHHILGEEFNTLDNVEPELPEEEGE